MNNTTAIDLIKHLELTSHPEGGFYKRVYTSPVSIEDRPICSSIYYLLEQGDYSGWHRINQDEIWFHHGGGPLSIYEINDDGQLITHRLDGLTQPQLCIPKGHWFAAELAQPTDEFTLVSCVVSPSFDFNDFEMGQFKILSEQYPQHAVILKRLCRA